MFSTKQHFFFLIYLNFYSSLKTETTFQHVHSTSEDGVDDDDDDDDDYMFDEQEDLLDMKVKVWRFCIYNRKYTLLFMCWMLSLSLQLEPSDPAQAKKFELKRMKTLQRRAKMSIMDRFCKAQVRTKVKYH